ncbi:MAG TPA: DUF47 family protein [Nitrososphaeraceae archaeon]|nr:DUF47 family protein [Nitrososphaeraceae archaeon]
MYSEEMEVQAKRKALAVLLDEINKIINSASELSNLTVSLINEENDDIKTSLERIRATEDEVENIRRKIIREVAEIGRLMGYREDVLRSAYIIDDIVDYISGIAFRLSNMNISLLKKSNYDKDIKTLIDKVVESIFKLNEMARALSINPVNTIELAQVQKLEREVNAKYRNMIIKAFKETEHTEELLLLKDTVEGIEGMADKCQEASDSFTILALSL